LTGSALLSWTLTLMLGAAGVTFLVRRGATVPDELSRSLHVAACAAMILMSWSWGMSVPALPQSAAFTLAAGWFLARAARPRPDGPRWHDLHHAAMTGALAWSITTMSAPHPVLAVYCVVAAGPWLYAALRGRAVAAAGHALMSAAMAVMFVAMA
jgi:hypothetical protein